MHTQKSKVHGHLSGRDLAARARENQPAIVMDAANVGDYRALARAGIAFDMKFLDGAMAFAMDDTQGGITSANLGAPVQFLQAWLPGFVRVVMAIRAIDELVGITTVGSWHDEEVVQGVLENLGDAVPYGDYTNVPLSDWNVNFERRTIVRFEKGMQVSTLEEARAATMKLNDAAEKRVSAAQALDIQRNLIGFVGYNSGNNRTYGFLNDPALPAYQNVPNGASASPLWSSKTYLEIVADIRTAAAALQAQSQGVIDPMKAPIVLALPTAQAQYLTVVSQFGNSVAKWIKDTYPNMRVANAPQLQQANGGANVFYMYAEEVNDSATDDSRVWVQAVPSKFQALGTHKTAKAYIEDYTNATAGVMLKRPYAVVRYSGI
jgi:hypothetical protein